MIICACMGTVYMVLGRPCIHKVVTPILSCRSQSSSIAMIYLSLLLLFLVLLPTGHAQNSLSCRNNFYSLEESLLSRPENRYQLMRTFYPPRDPRPIIVKVIYTFSGDMNYTDVWFWSESQFYLIQPLEIFQYTSLFFSNLPHRQSEVTVELDEDCFGANNEHMELLTQRVRLSAIVFALQIILLILKITDNGFHKTVHHSIPTVLLQSLSNL